MNEETIIKYIQEQEENDKLEDGNGTARSRLWRNPGITPEGLKPPPFEMGGDDFSICQELALLYRFNANFHSTRHSTKNRSGAAVPQRQAKGESSPMRNRPGKFVITKMGRI